MTLRAWALRKGKRCTDVQNVVCLAKALPSQRCQSTSAETKTKSTTDRPTLPIESIGASRAGKRHTNKKLSDRDLFLDVLTATATKREARAYLSRFGSPPSPREQPLTVEPVTDAVFKRRTCGVNLGNLYLPTRAVDESPVFSRATDPKPFVDLAAGPIHTALVKITSPQSIDDKTLQAVGYTLSQLTQLGLSCVVVVDQCPSENTLTTSPRDWRINANKQADRVVGAIEFDGGQAARSLDSVIKVLSSKNHNPSKIKVHGRAKLTNRNLLLAPLRRGSIPVVSCMGFEQKSQRVVPVDADEVVLAIARDFAGLAQSEVSQDDTLDVSESIKQMQQQISLDRIIILGAHGGIPSARRINGSHIFINLEQEYDSIKEELGREQYFHPGSSPLASNIGQPSISTIGPSNPLPEIVESETASSLKDAQVSEQMSHLATKSRSATIHLNNLKLVRDALALLPPSSSAILTTPKEAANSTRQATSSSEPGVGTRSLRNPLIHNLLTDKPIFSSSLPPTRLCAKPSPQGIPGSRSSPTTFVKRGMPITIIPDPRTHPWVAPSTHSAPLQLSDPRIDLPRLIHLIEDSFGRKIDAEHYLKRISTNLAGIIIAGAYEGGAILTWETPPQVPYSSASPHHLVPYLDKFAVLQRSQGAGGVADVVFSAMVRDCFPRGVCWRSRRDNPVNKWYFERAKGTWKIPVSGDGQGWTMFWTTEGLGGERFEDYEGVCRSVGTSWADGRAVLD